MPSWTIWLVPAVAAGLTLILVWPLRRYLLVRNLVDLPDSRRSHAVPTPRGGGLAMAAGLGLAGLFLVLRYGQGWSLLLLFMLLSGLGWLDDRHDLNVVWRLLVQLAIASFAVISVGVPAVIEFGPLSVASGPLLTMLAIVAVVWLINLHNFMDGSDGLAAGQGIWSGLAFGLAFSLSQAWFEALVAFSLTGACLGFLYWNRPPARVFMGDSGSLLLGGSVAWLALSGAASGTVGVLTSAIICSLFVVDASATLLRRMMAGQRWYNPHRSHAYQRLITSGWSHGRVLALYGLINGLIVLPMFLIGLFHPELEFWLTMLLAGLLIAGWGCLQSKADGDEEKQA